MGKKSVISLVLALAVLLSLAVMPIRADAAVALSDGGFEGSIWSDGIWSYWLPEGEGWSGKTVEQFSYASDQWMTPPENGGSSCLKFYLSSAGSFYFTQVLENVPAGSYTLSAQSMGAAGETVAVVMGDMTGDQVQTDSGYNNWTETSGTFQLTADCAELIVGVKVTCTAGGWGYVDNLTMTESKAEHTELSLANGGFETGDAANWALSGYSAVGVDPYAANNTTNTLSLWLSDSAAAAGSASYTVSLTPGSYYFTFDLEGKVGSSGLGYSITGNGQTLISGDSIYSTTGWDAWQTHQTSEFTLDAETEVTFTLSGTQTAGYWGHLDNLKLYGTGSMAETAPEPVQADIYVPYVKGTDGDFMRGMDVSSMLSILESGASFQDWEGNPLDGQGFFDLLADSGVNWVRLRVWNDPFDANGNGYGGGNCDVDAAVTMGKWATNAGLRVFIDFHYSDFWADPDKQQVPKAWEGYSVDQLAAAIEEYTAASLKKLLDAGVDVGMVQVGNETTNAMCGVSDWIDRCKLFSAGAKAVRAADPGILVAIHFTNPERTGNYANFARQLDTYSVDYDVFASSYYPYWHGTLSNLTSVLKQVADTYGKQVIVAETSWAYTLADGDGHSNTVRKGSNDTDAAYSFSVQGQATEIASVTQAVKAVGAQGAGVFYWESAWIPVQVYDSAASDAAKTLAENQALWEAHGSGWASSYAVEYDPDDAGVWYGGSAVDNQALFDFTGNPLDSLKVFEYMQTGTTGYTITVTAVEEPTLEYTVGDTLALPETLAVSFSVGADETRAVTWNAGDLAAVDMHRPGTYQVRGTVEGDLETVCTVKVKSKNLLKNPGFEEADTSMYVSSQSYAAVTGDDPHSGSKSLHFYSSGLVDFTTEQTVTLEPGHYLFSLYGQGGDLGSDAKTYAYVKLGDTTLTADFILNGWLAWADPQISFDVTEKTVVTVGVSVTATQNGAWGTFDDWYLCENTEPVHIGGTATCKEQAKCTVCDLPYGELSSNHTGGTATCKEQAKCTICGLPYGELSTTHTGGAATCKELAKCTVCGLPYGQLSTTHTGGTATCKEQAKCTICDLPYGELSTTHTGGTATCKEQAKCTVCGLSYGELDRANHTGGTELRDQLDATSQKLGYTGDTYCVSCGEKLATGKPIPKKESEISPTGDETNLLLAGTLMLLSALALTALTTVPSLKKRK